MDRGQNRKECMKRSTVLGSSAAGLLTALVLVPAASASAAPTGVTDCVFTPTTAHTVALQADCTTDHTLLIPTGDTLDGQGHTITAMDPAGGSFLGGVLKNEGAIANVHNVTVTASGLSQVCHSGSDRLRGILFDGTGGTIDDVTVTGVRQGQSGCQEGNAIEVRNFSAQGTRAAKRLTVKVTNNKVSNYQKNGITINGLYTVTVEGNSVVGDGAATYIAQNGIQIGYGGKGVVKNNDISGNYYTGSATGTTAAGLLLYGERAGSDDELTRGVTAGKNVLADNQVADDTENYDVSGPSDNPTYTVTTTGAGNTAWDNWIWADPHTAQGVTAIFDRGNGDSYLNNRISGYTTAFDTTGAKHLTKRGNEVRP
jgi:hypothetical protein